LSISSSLVYVTPEMIAMRTLSSSPSLASGLSEHQLKPGSDIRAPSIDMGWTVNPLYACATAPEFPEDSELESGIGTDGSEGWGKSEGLEDFSSAASTWCETEGVSFR
jgi:hypothetical protein